MYVDHRLGRKNGSQKAKRLLRKSQPTSHVETVHRARQYVGVRSRRVVADKPVAEKSPSWRCVDHLLQETNTSRILRVFNDKDLFHIAQ